LEKGEDMMDLVKRFIRFSNDTGGEAHIPRFREHSPPKLTKEAASLAKLFDAPVIQLDTSEDNDMGELDSDTRKAFEAEGGAIDFSSLSPEKGKLPSAETVQEMCVPVRDIVNEAKENIFSVYQNPPTEREIQRVIGLFLQCRCEGVMKNRNDEFHLWARPKIMHLHNYTALQAEVYMFVGLPWPNACKHRMAAYRSMHVYHIPSEFPPEIDAAFERAQKKADAIGTSTDEENQEREVPEPRMEDILRDSDDLDVTYMNPDGSVKGDPSRRLYVNREGTLELEGGDEEHDDNSDFNAGVNGGGDLNDRSSGEYMCYEDVSEADLNRGERHRRVRRAHKQRLREMAERNPYGWGLGGAAPRPPRHLRGEGGQRVDEEGKMGDHIVLPDSDTNEYNELDARELEDKVVAMGALTQEQERFVPEIPSVQDDDVDRLKRERQLLEEGWKFRNPGDPLDADSDADRERGEEFLQEMLRYSPQYERPDGISGTRLAEAAARRPPL